MSFTPEAFFLPVHGGGQRFCLFHPSQSQEPLGSILYVHPFAEEMNKARRMAALQARALAQAGYAVLQLDLLGCGDSSGDFGDATWNDWVDDVVRGSRWLLARSGGPLWLWGLRAGCLLAATAQQQLDIPCNLIFWSPVAAGKTQLHQFLRLKAAADLMGGASKGKTESLRQQLSEGTGVEVAGYHVSSGLANGLEQSVLAPSGKVTDSVRLEWFEVSTREDATLSPAAQKAVSQWAGSGFVVQSHIVNGVAFWQTLEIEDAPALIAATVAAMPRQRQLETA